MHDEINGLLLEAVTNFLENLLENGIPVTESENANTLIEHLNNIVELAKLQGVLEDDQPKHKWLKRAAGAAVGTASLAGAHYGAKRLSPAYLSKVIDMKKVAATPLRRYANTSKKDSNVRKISKWFTSNINKDRASLKKMNKKK